MDNKIKYANMQEYKAVDDEKQIIEFVASKEIPDYDTAIVDKIFFDLDSKNSFNSIKKFHEFLMKENLKHCMTMSGGGFHCYVACKVCDFRDK